jgi:nitrite reductase (NADH) small subunit/3-phenylpropionate/trans-cinnamate dioxygenase ferredoxin subunit
MATFVTVAHASAIPRGTGTVVTVHGYTIALFNLQGTFYAIDNLCPHRDYPLGMSPVLDNLVMCIGHAWRFDIKTGECRSIPGVRVQTYEVAVEGDEVKIRVDAIPGEGRMAH